MGKYFDNIGVAAGGIKLHSDGVWLVPKITDIESIDSSGEKITTKHRELNIAIKKDGSDLAIANVATPLMQSGLKVGTTIPESQVATVEWVTWALNATELPTIELTKYNNAVELTNELNTKYTALNNQINGTDQNSIVNQLAAIKTIVSESQFTQLEALLSDVVVLWGGNAAGWESDE